MSPTLAEPPPVRSSAQSADYAAQLRRTMAATKLSFTWFGVRRALSAAQKAQAAETFGAEAKYVSAAKKLLDTTHPAYQVVTSLRGQITQTWKACTLPYPEPGLRLMRQQDLGDFATQLQQWQRDLHQAVLALDEVYAELRQAARNRLGDLYNTTDYPASLAHEFSLAWEFPSVEPPSYLAQLNPDLYAAECQRGQQRFTEAVALAEQAFLEEFAQMITHLTERLAGQDDGTPKVYRDLAVENLRAFFERFRQLDIGSQAELEQLVEQAQQIVRGVQPQQLRTSTSLRQQVATQLAGVQASLEGLLVDRPRRAIQRPTPQETP